MKKITFLLLASIILLASNCKKDKSAATLPTSTNVTEDKEQIEQNLSDVVNCMRSFQSGHFMESTVNFLGLTNGESTQDIWVEKLLENLFEEEDFSYLDTENKFILAKHTGTYHYNAGNKSWTKYDNETAKAIFKFPSSPSASSNDMTIIVGAYTDSKASFDGDLLNVPKSGSVELFKNNKEIAHVKLSNFSWEAVDAELSIPTNIDASIMLHPHTYKLSLNRETGTSFKAAINMTSTAGCGYELAGTLNLTNDNISKLEEEDIEELLLTFKQGFFEVKFQIDVNGLWALNDDPSVSELNSKMNTTVHYFNQHIGNIEFYTKPSGETGMQIRYKDNSTEDMEEAYMEKFFDEMDNMFLDVTGGV